MDELSATVENYLGQEVQERYGIRSEPIEKPDALVLTQQMKSTGRLLCSGGLLDQPYIWMREYKVCSDLLDLFAALKRVSQKDSPK